MVVAALREVKHGRIELSSARVAGPPLSPDLRARGSGRGLGGHAVRGPFRRCFLDGSGTAITSTTVLDGFTVTGGHADGMGNPDEDGGGLYCNGYSTGSVCSPKLAHLAFRGNSALEGGAIYNRGASAPLGSSGRGGGGGARYRTLLDTL